MKFSFPENIKLLKSGILAGKEMEIDIAINALNTLLDLQEQGWQDIQNEFEEYIKKDERYNGLEEEQYKSQYYRQFYEAREWVIDKLQNVQRNSLCVSIYSVYENKLTEMCRELETKYEFGLPLNDINEHSKIKRCWIHLKGNLGIEKEEFNPYFTVINMQLETRNFMTHAEGKVPIKMLNKINKADGLKIKEYKEFAELIIEDTTYLTNLINNVRELFNTLLWRIDSVLTKTHDG